MDIKNSYIQAQMTILYISIEMKKDRLGFNYIHLKNVLDFSDRATLI